MTEINELFVSYEIANELKQLGFNEGCFGFYNKKKLIQRNMYQYNEDYNIKMVLDDFMINHLNDIDCLAPLKSQALNYVMQKLEKIYNLIYLEISSDGSGSYNGSQCQLAHFDNWDDAIHKGIKLMFNN